MYICKIHSKAPLVHICGHIIFIFYFGKSFILSTKTKSPHKWTYECCSLVNIGATASCFLFISSTQRWPTQVQVEQVHPDQVFCLNNLIYINFIFLLIRYIYHNILMFQLVQTYIANHLRYVKARHLNVCVNVCGHRVLITVTKGER